MTQAELTLTEHETIKSLASVEPHLYDWTDYAHTGPLSGITPVAQAALAEAIDAFLIDSDCFRL